MRDHPRTVDVELERRLGATVDNCSVNASLAVLALIIDLTISYQFTELGLRGLHR